MRCTRINGCSGNISISEVSVIARIAGLGKCLPITALVALSALAHAATGFEPEQAWFTRLSTDDGLSSAVIYNIAQDQTGFMWFATEAGLDRYDGYELRSLTEDPGNDQSAGIGDVADVLVDSKGVMWIAAWGDGLIRYDPQTDHLDHFTSVPGDATALQDDRLQVLFEDRSHALWIGSLSGGLSRFDQGAESFQTFRHDPGDPNSLSGERVWAICETSNGTLWIGTGGGLSRLEPGGRSFTSFNNDPGNRSGLPASVVRTVSIDRAGVLWVGTEKGLGTFDGETGLFVPLLGDSPAVDVLHKVPINVVLHDSTGVMWVGTYGHGLYSVDRTTLEVTKYHCAPERNGDLSNNDVRALFEDRSGVLWIGTRGGGVNRLDLRAQRFSSVRNDPDDLDSVGPGRVNALLEDRFGTLWVGGSAGLSRLDPDGAGFIRYGPDPEDPGSLPIRVVQALLEDRAGTMWVGTWRGGLSRMVDRERGTFVTYHNDPDDPSSLSDERVSRLFEDSRGTLWVGTYTGVEFFHPESETFSRPDGLSFDQSGGSPVWVEVIHEDYRGRIWIGTDTSGLTLFDPLSGEVTSYWPAKDAPEALRSRRVRDIYEAPDHRMWFATADGLSMFDLETERSFRFDERHGLPSASVNSMLMDDHDHLWVATGQGLCRLDPATGTIRAYTIADGLPSNAFTDGARGFGRDGRMYFGGPAGYCAFRPEPMFDDLSPPPVVLSSFRRFDQLLDFGRPAHQVDEIELSYRDNFFSVEFAALDFRNPARNTYQYILEGFDRRWNHAGNRRIATYTDVKPGRYTFRAQASNRLGVWNREGLHLTIRVVPPLWQTWWFRFGAVALVVLGLLMWVRFKLATQRRLQHELEHQVDVRTADLAEANRRIADQNERLEALSRTDPLTGLGNRRVIEERLPLEMAILMRERERVGSQDETPSLGIGILMVDIDNFKEINDCHGHDAGDAYLKAIAATLQESLREVDLVVRWGGDEFVVLTRRQSSKGLKDLSAKLQNATDLMDVRLNNGTVIRGTTSTGFILHPLCADRPVSAEAWPRLVEVADRQMYLAKARGRARACGLVPAPGRPSGPSEKELLEAAVVDPSAPPQGLESVEIVAPV